MKIELDKKQYENLIKLVYLGNWMVNAIRDGSPEDKEIERYNEIEQYIFSFAKNADLEKYIEFDDEVGQFFPTNSFEFETDVEQYRQEYNDETFWDELIDRLARRDFIKKYGEDTVRKMGWKELIEKEDPFIEKYSKEIEKNGLDNLELNG